MTAIVVDLGYGDSGKGTMVDALVRERKASLVVRFNGGPQAAHNVVTPEGVHHTFSSFGSGSLTVAATHISRFSLVDPFAMQRERDVLRSKGYNPVITVDPMAIVITPYHGIINQLRELSRGARRHGSVGLGVGVARQDEIDSAPTLRAGDLGNPSTTFARLSQIKDRHCDEANQLMHYDLSMYDRFMKETPFALADRYALMNIHTSETRSLLFKHESVVFEGAQGVLIDELWGFAPYNTWTDCTFANADTLLAEAGMPRGQRIGVVRTYATRHGAGPFPTEDDTVQHPESHNVRHPWMGGFRQGHFDAVAVRYAIKACGGIDGLAITHCDRPVEKICNLYRIDGHENNDLMLLRALSSGDITDLIFRAQPVYQLLRQPVEEIEASLGQPVLYTSHGPTCSDKAGVFDSEVCNHA